MSTGDAREVHSVEKRGRAYPNPEAKLAVCARLERVRTEKGFQSKRAFWEALCDGWDDAVSYEAVRRYHYDREPPASYLARVAELFPEASLEWLITGRKENRGSPEELDQRDREWVEHLEPGESEQARARRSAVLHFARKLQRADFPGAPWSHPLQSHPRARRELLEAAMTFLKGVEEARIQAASRLPQDESEAVRRHITKNEILLGHSHSHAWNVYWMDRALDLFADTVRGLGVRKGGLHDSHDHPLFPLVARKARLLTQKAAATTARARAPSPGERPDVRPDPS